MHIGIDAIDYYLPKLALPIEELAKKREIPPAKLEKGLGLKTMALADVDEDTASMAANALLNLIQRNNIQPNKIGRIYLGTESALDAAKPTITYAVGTVEEKLKGKFGDRCFKNCDVIDMTFACIGAIDALENCIDWIRADTKRQAIVIASDIAKYELGSSGEYTQGAGAVAMLVKNNPDLLAINSTIGVSSQHVGDFFKPRRILSNDMLKSKAGVTINEILETKKDELELFYEEPVFDGQYSNICYKERIKEALKHFKSQKKDVNFLTDWDHYIFHLPYAYQGRKVMLDFWIEWLKENYLLGQLENEIGKMDLNIYKDWKKAASKSSFYSNFITQKITAGEKASSFIGNMYTASIFMSLISLLTTSFEENKDVTSNKIGFLSYGSGSKSKILEGVISKNWKSKVENLNVFKSIEERKIIDFECYEKIHNGVIKKPVHENNAIVLKGIETKKDKEGFRYYN